MNNIQKTVTVGLCFILSQLIFQTAVTAHNKVVVVPLGVNNKTANVITVSKENGDFTDPVAAINSFSDEAADNRYLIILRPGVYRLNETLVMRPYIDIVGFGFASKLEGLISSSSISGNYSIIQGANDSSVGNLRVENGCGENDYCSGIINDGASPALFNLYVMVHGSNYQYGITNRNSSSPVVSNTTINLQGIDLNESIGMSSINGSSPVLNNVEFQVSGASFNAGLYTSSSSSVEISDSRVYVTSATGVSANNYGVMSNINSTSVITDTEINVGHNDSASSSGVRNSNGSSSILLNSTVHGYSDNSSYGIVNATENDYISIRNSMITGGTESVAANIGADSKETRIFDSTLTGSVSGDPMCWSVTSGGGPLDINCQ